MPSVGAIVTAVGLAVFATAHQVRYDGCQVYRLRPVDEAQLESLRRLEALGYDFWKAPSAVNVSVEMLVGPGEKSTFLRFLNGSGLTGHVSIPDVQRLIDDSAVAVAVAERSANFDWNSYRRTDAVHDWLEGLARDFPENVTVLTVGGSLEGRAIKGARVSFGPGKKAFFIEGGIHAREWISPAVVTFLLDQVIRNTTASVSRVVRNYDWYIFPILNPDGYEYTFSRNRLWRKNRQPWTAGPLGRFCRGTDLNRNWDFHWREKGGGSWFPCSDTYAGRKAFSTDETVAVADFLQTIGKNTTAHLSFHSYGQHILLPPAYSTRPTENHRLLTEVGERAAGSLRALYGTNYTVGNSLEVLKYVASGTSMDWADGVLNVPFAYTFELRDTGTYGFLLPPRLILPTARETFEAVLAVAREAVRRGYV